MSRVTLANITTAEATVSQELAKFVTVQDYSGAADYCLKATVSNTVDASVDSCLHRFFLGLWFLENSKNHSYANAKTVQDITKICEALLQLCGIRPISSKHSVLYSRIYHGLGQYNSGVGNPWTAMWQSNIGQYLAQASHDMTPDEAMIAADRAYFLGHNFHAASAYFFVEQNASDTTLKAEACLGRVMSLRMMGEVHQAQELVALGLFEYARLGSLTIDFKWQELLCAMTASGDTTEIVKVWDSNSSFYQAKYCILAALILYSVKGTFDHSKIRKSRTLRVNFADEISRGTEEFELCKMLTILENCYDERESLIARLKELGEFLESTTIRRTSEEYLLFYTSAIRWLTRVKQNQFVAYVINDYSAICLSLSQGKSVDVLGLVGDLRDSAELINLDHDSLPGLPMTSSKRMLKLSSLVIKAGTMFLKNKLPGKPLPLPGQQNHADHIMVQVAELIIDEIGTIKGPLMKLAQTLIGVKSVPLEVRQKLATALATTRHLDARLFYEVFKQEQGRPHTEVFRNWQDKPIGIGTMGQVFKAELPDGTPVAVKIIYPKITQLVRADLKILRLLKPLIRYIAEGIDVDGLVNLYTRGFLDECDLRQEAIKHQRMCDILANNPTVSAPKLFSEYTSSSVLVMEYIHGQKLFEFTPYATAAQRQGIVDTIVAVYFDCIINHNFLPTDLHPGNVILRDGKPVLVDFGGYIELQQADSKLMHNYYKVMVAQGDDKSLYRSLTDDGIFNPDFITEELFCKKLAPILMLWSHQHFDPWQHHFFDFFDIYFHDSNIRRGVSLNAEETVQFISIFMLVTTAYSLLTTEDLAYMRGQPRSLIPQGGISA